MEIVSLRGFEKVCKIEYEGTDATLPYEEVELPKRATKFAAGYDVKSTKAFTLEPGEDITIPTGFKAYMQPGEMLAIYPRSGMGFKYQIQLANTVGIGDGDYYNCESNEGHYFVKLVNRGKKTWEVKEGDGIAQAIFQPVLLVDGDEFGLGEDRKGGFGSTDEEQPKLVSDDLVVRYADLFGRMHGSDKSNALINGNTATVQEILSTKAREMNVTAMYSPVIDECQSTIDMIENIKSKLNNNELDEECLSLLATMYGTHKSSDNDKSLLSKMCSQARNVGYTLDCSGESESAIRMIPGTDDTELTMLPVDNAVIDECYEIYSSKNKTLFDVFKPEFEIQQGRRLKKLGFKLLEDLKVKLINNELDADCIALLERFYLPKKLDEIINNLKNSEVYKNLNCKGQSEEPTLFDIFKPEFNRLIGTGLDDVELNILDNVRTMLVNNELDGTCRDLLSNLLGKDKLEEIINILENSEVYKKSASERLNDFDGERNDFYRIAYAEANETEEERLVKLVKLQKEYFETTSLAKANGIELDIDELNTNIEINYSDEIKELLNDKNLETLKDDNGVIIGYVKFDTNEVPEKVATYLGAKDCTKDFMTVKDVRNVNKYYTLDAHDFLFMDINSVINVAQCIKSTSELKVTVCKHKRGYLLLVDNVSDKEVNFSCRDLGINIVKKAYTLI